MTYIETTKTSYTSRIGNSFKGVIFGILLIIGSVMLLWWNEGRTIDVATGLSETQKITVDGKTESIDSSLENKIVYNTGNATTQEILKDTDFGLETNAIKLIKTAEMYQWQENVKEDTQDNLGGSQTITRTYTYQKVWNSAQLPSDNYKEVGHTNPTTWKYSSNTIQAQDVHIGELKLSNNYISQMNNVETIHLPQDSLTGLKKASNDQDIRLQNNYIYYGSGSISAPIIGDIRIQFSEVKPAEVSTIGLQKSNTLIPYLTSRDTEVALLEYGIKTKEQMFQTAQENNKILAWILRGVGLLLMFIGFNLLFGVLVAISKVIPMLGNILNFGVSIIAFILTLILGFGVIIVAWFFVRPFLSIGLIILVGGIIWFIFKKKKEKLVSGGNVVEKEVKLGSDEEKKI